MESGIGRHAYAALSLLGLRHLGMKIAHHRPPASASGRWV